MNYYLKWKKSLDKTEFTKYYLKEDIYPSICKDCTYFIPYTCGAGIPIKGEDFDSCASKVIGPNDIRISGEPLLSPKKPDLYSYFSKRAISIIERANRDTLNYCLRGLDHWIKLNPIIMDSVSISDLFNTGPSGYKEVYIRLCISFLTGYAYYPSDKIYDRLYPMLMNLMYSVNKNMKDPNYKIEYLGMDLPIGLVFIELYQSDYPPLYGNQVTTYVW